MSYVDDLLDDIYSIISENDPTDQESNPVDLLPIDRQLFDAWLARKEIFAQIRSADIDYLIFKKIRDHHYHIFSQPHMSAPISKLNPTLKEYCLNYMAGSIAMFILHWMDQGMPHTPDDLAGLLQALNMRDFPTITGKFNNLVQ